MEQTRKMNIEHDRRSDLYLNIMLVGLFSFILLVFNMLTVHDWDLEIGETRTKLSSHQYMVGETSCCRSPTYAVFYLEGNKPSIPQYFSVVQVQVPVLHSYSYKGTSFYTVGNSQMRRTLAVLTAPQVHITR